MYTDKTCWRFADLSNKVLLEKNELESRIKKLPSRLEMRAQISSILQLYDKKCSSTNWLSFFAHGKEGKERAHRLRELIGELPDSSEACFIKLYDFWVEEKNNCQDSLLCQLLDSQLRCFLELPEYSCLTRINATLGRRYDQDELVSKIALEDLKFANIADLIREKIPYIVREVIEPS